MASVANEQEMETKQDKTTASVLGIYLLSMAAISCYLVIKFWPPCLLGSNCSPPVLLLWGVLTLHPDLNARLIILVLAAGALGSYIHTATSLADFVGNRRFSSSWTWWYFLRPSIGMALALIFYFVIRGGLFAQPESAAINPYGIAAVAGMVGMFSKQAADKLRELFDNLFKVEKEVPREDPLENPAPTVTSVEPNSVVAGSTNVGIKLTGTNFMKESKVQVNGAERETKYENETTLTAQLLDSDVAAAATLTLTVVNPTPGGGTSEPVSITVQ